MSRLTGTDAYGLMEAYNNVYAPQELTEEQVWEEVENWVNSLLEEGYDLSDYTWEEMYESYIEQLNEAPMTAFQAAGGNAKLAQLNKGRSPRSGRATASTIERQGQQNLYKAGGGDAAIAKGPTTTRNVRGGGTQQVPTLTRQDIINRGTNARSRPATPAPATRPAPAPTAARPAPAPTGGAQRPIPSATTVPVRPATPAAAKPAPAATPVAKAAPAAAAPSTAATGFKLAQQGVNLAAPAAPKKPSLASGIDDLKKMGDASRQRQGLTQSFDVFDVIRGHLIDEGYADTEEAALQIMANMSEEWRQSILDEGDNYDRNRQRAAKRAKERNEARARGQTGNVPGIGYVSPRPERTTYRDAAGTERHHSGARMPEKNG